MVLGMVKALTASFTHVLLCKVTSFSRKKRLCRKFFFKKFVHLKIFVYLCTRNSEMKAKNNGGIAQLVRASDS